MMRVHLYYLLMTLSVYTTFGDTIWEVNGALDSNWQVTTTGNGNNHADPCGVDCTSECNCYHCYNTATCLRIQAAAGVSNSITVTRTTSVTKYENLRLQFRVYHNGLNTDNNRYCNFVYSCSGTTYGSYDFASRIQEFYNIPLQSACDKTNSLTTTFRCTGGIDANKGRAWIDDFILSGTISTTKAPTTKAPTTKAPTTKVPTTKAPTTKTPTTKAPTTKAPTTNAPTTKTPTTKAPTTKAPTTKAPTMNPTKGPSAVPTPSPTSNPTTIPTSSPTAKPTAVPTVKPTATPSFDPTTKTTPTPTASPTVKPTAIPTANPTAKPTADPTKGHGAVLTPALTFNPTTIPTSSPTAKPTAIPTVKPTATPSFDPTLSPTANPAQSEINNPITSPTSMPTASPSWFTTNNPTTESVEDTTVTVLPSKDPTVSPTKQRTTASTNTPSSAPIVTTLPSYSVSSPLWIIKIGATCSDGYTDLNPTDEHYNVYCQPCPDNTAGVYGTCEKCQLFQQSNHRRTDCQYIATWWSFVIIISAAACLLTCICGICCGVCCCCCSKGRKSKQSDANCEKTAGGLKMQTQMTSINTVKRESPYTVTSTNPSAIYDFDYEPKQHEQYTIPYTDGECIEDSNCYDL